MLHAKTAQNLATWWVPSTPLL